jgi:hypothetical protein
MTVPVIEYTPETVGQMLADARARRARLYKPGPDPVRKVAPPAPKPEPVIVDPDHIRDWLALATPGTFDVADYAQIIKLVCQSFNVPRIDLISERRTAKIVLPRMVACWLMRYHTTMSLPQIGRRLGGRDHTTILSAVRKIDRLLAQGRDDIRAAIDAILAQMNAQQEAVDE